MEMVNLAEVNPTRVGRRSASALVDRPLPLQLEIGRVQAQLLPTRSTGPRPDHWPANGRRGHLFGHVYWAVLLASPAWCSAAGVLLQCLQQFPVGDLVKYVLRETVATIGAFVLALAISSACWSIAGRCAADHLGGLIYLLYGLLTILAEHSVTCSRRAGRAPCSISAGICC